MRTDTFVRLIMAEILRSKDVSDTSFLRSNVRAVGRKFEARAIDVPGVLTEIERLLPWQLSRDIKKSIEKSLR